MTETHNQDPWGDAMTARLFGELEREPRRLLEEHIQRSPEVRKQWEQMAEFFDALAAVPTPDAPADLEASLLQNLTAPAEAVAYSPSQAPVPVRPAVARVAVVQGDVRVATNRRAASGKSPAWLLAMEGDVLVEGSMVEIGPGGRALLRLNDSSELWLNANTLLRFGKRAAGAFVRLMRGEVLAFVAKQKRALPIMTPDGLVSVLGTVFDTRLRVDGGTEVSVLEGRVGVSSGAGKREIQALRRVKLTRGTSVAKPRRMGPGEMKRLETWTSALASVSRAERRTLVRSTRRRGIARIGAFAVVGVLALAGGFALWSAKSEPTVEERVAEVRESRPDPVAYTPSSPPSVHFTPALGSAWRAELFATGTMLLQRVGGADIRLEMSTRLATVSRILSPEGTETARVQHRITEVDLQLKSPMAEGEEDMEEGTREVTSGLASATFTEYRGPRWELLSVNLDTPGTLQPVQRAGLQAIWASFIALPAGLPTEPLTAGMQWAQPASVATFDTFAMTAGSQVNGFAMRDNNPIALLSTSLNGNLTAPYAFPPLIAIMVGPATRIREMTLSQEGVTELRLSDGLPIFTSGHLEQRGVLDLGPTQVSGRMRERTMRMRMNVDTTLRFEPITSAP